MDILEHLRSPVAIRNIRGQQARLAGLAENRNRPFAGDQRLVICADQHFCALGKRVFDQQFGISLERRGDGVRVAQRLRSNPVLAIGAVQVAAQHSETVGEGSRVGVEEWLLLDRVTLNSSDIAPGNIERATVIEANLADTGLSLGNRAAMAAGIAAYPIAIQLFPKSRVAFADAGVGSEDVVQGCHRYILRLRDWVCLSFVELPPVERRGLPRLLAETRQAASLRELSATQFASDFARWLWEWSQTSACWRAAETCVWVIWEANPSSRDLLFSSPSASASADQKYAFDKS